MPLCHFIGKASHHSPSIALVFVAPFGPHWALRAEEKPTLRQREAIAVAVHVDEGVAFAQSPALHDLLDVQLFVGALIRQALGTSHGRQLFPQVFLYRILVAILVQIVLLCGRSSLGLSFVYSC